MAQEINTTDEARARLLADLSHEIRTPLATLEAHIDGLEDAVLPPDTHSFEVMRGQVPSSATVGKRRRTRGGDPGTPCTWRSGPRR